MHPIWSFVATLTGQSQRVKQRRVGQTLYLTFDDGPHPVNTPKLLDVLQAVGGVKVTFFLLGQQAQAHPEIVRRIVQEGHTIANHSMTHANFRRLGVAAQLTEIAQADQVLQAFDGLRRHGFRPPRGNATLTTIANAVLRRQKLFLWGFDSFDFRLSLPELTQRLSQYQPQGGDILLFHDDMATTVCALQEILPRWQAAGFRFGCL